MIDVVGYGASGFLSKTLKRMEFTCEDPGAHDVQIDVMFCGVCHSDIHQVENDWGNTVYPCVPGHEVVGRVSRIGAAVTQHAVGDIVGVGCMRDSCRTCAACVAGEENYCLGPNSWLATYNGPMVPSKKAPTGTNMYGRDNTFGGYSTALVVSEDFVIAIPAGLDPAHAAPILCAGVTTFSPMRHWGVKAGDAVGIIGFGGLGNMAVKLAVGLGAHVTIFTTSKDKVAEGLALGAQKVVVESDKEAMKEVKRSFDFMLATIPEKFEMDPFVELLKHNATLTVVGALEKLAPVNNMEAAMMRKSVAGSLIGSIAETREVLEFCAQKGITPDIQMVKMADINDAFARVNKGEVRFRYVIDMAGLQA